jgi:hypothetical protein
VARPAAGLVGAARAAKRAAKRAAARRAAARVARLTRALRLACKRGGGGRAVGLRAAAAAVMMTAVSAVVASCQYWVLVGEKVLPRSGSVGLRLYAV